MKKTIQLLGYHHLWRNPHLPAIFPDFSVKITRHLAQSPGIFGRAKLQRESDGGGASGSWPTDWWFDGELLNCLNDILQQRGYEQIVSIFCLSIQSIQSIQSYNFFSVSNIFEWPQKSDDPQGLSSKTRWSPWTRMPTRRITNPGIIVVGEEKGSVKCGV